MQRVVWHLALILTFESWFLHLKADYYIEKWFLHWKVHKWSSPVSPSHQLPWLWDGKASTQSIFSLQKFKMQHHNLLLGHNHMDFMQTKCDIQDRTVTKSHQNNWHIWWTFSYFSNSNWIGDNYIRHSGFLPLADANDVILLFPQVSPHFYSTLAFPGSGLERRSRWSYNPPPCQIHPLNSAGNANGCWDW